MKRLISLLFVSNLFLVSNEICAQNKKLEIYPTLGLSWRSTIIRLDPMRGWFSPIIPTRTSPGHPDFSAPYDLERNVQGFSLNTGLQFRYGRLGLEYHLNPRYDVIYSVSDPHTGLSGDPAYVKRLLFDHNFNLSMKIGMMSYGVGMTIVNAGAGYYWRKMVYQLPDETRYHHIDFKSYNFLITVPIKKVIHLEVKALYVPHGFPDPSSADEKPLMINLRVYYKFNFLNKMMKGLWNKNSL